MKETKTSSLTKFNISLLLSMAKIHRYEDTVTIKNYIYTHIYVYKLNYNILNFIYLFICINTFFFLFKDF